MSCKRQLSVEINAKARDAARCCDAVVQNASKLSVMVKFERLSGLSNYRLSRPTGTFFTFFNVFFSKSKKHDFLRFFELPHTFSRTLFVAMVLVA